MKMRKRFGAFLVLIGMLVALMPLMAVADHPNSVHWVGNGVSDGEFDEVDCRDSGGLDATDGFIHWVFTGNSADSVTLFINGSEVGDMSQSGNGAWHFFSAFYDLNSISAYVEYEGDLGNGRSVLTISHGCEPEGTTTTSSTTTTQPTTTTTEPTTTTTEGETTTTQPEETTTTSEPEETTTTVEDTTTTTVEGTTTTEPDEEEPTELPFTGPSDSLPFAAALGAMLVASGGFVLRKATQVEDI